MFLNPYLTKKSKNPKLAKESDTTRIIPLCFKDPGTPGIIGITRNIQPLYFFNDKECKIDTSDGKSMWTKQNKVFLDVVPDNDFDFHVYDIIETVYTQDSCDYVPFSLQEYIIPCGVVLKMLGRRADGASVCVNVFGERPYFYTSCTTNNIHYHVNQILMELSFNRKMPCKVAIEEVIRKSIMGFGNEEEKYNKITLSNPHIINSLETKLKELGYKTFEANVDTLRRFIIDNKFSTFGWYKCKNATKRVNTRLARDSFTDFEYDCESTNLTLLSNKTNWPPYNILSFDIECIGQTGFPNASRDEDLILQISCVLWTIGCEHYRKILLSLGTCNVIENVEIYEFPSEYDMLYAFFCLLRDGNIEFITGYNTANFDIPYIIDRAKIIYNLDPAMWCKVKTGSKFEVHKPKDNSKDFSRSITKVKISGLVSIDMYMMCKDKLSLSNYKLDTVAKHILGAQKEDVSYKEIPHLFRKGPDGRQKLGNYCMQDSILVMDILKHFMVHVEVSEIAKIANIPARRVINDGQQIRVFSCLLAAAREDNFILPMPEKGSGDGYQGATVINPLSGFYNCPVLVVDFASLYPSIIQAHNLCYSTIITKNNINILSKLSPNDYETFVLSGETVHFVKSHIQQSFLSKLLTSWLNKRKAIRKTLATCDNEQQKVILDKQQLAIKVTCNAVYGFTGVANGLFPCLKIAETVTLQGRNMLQKSKEFIEQLEYKDLIKLCKTKIDIPNDAYFKVIYGDTDSLFIQCINFPIDSLSKIADDIADEVTQKLFVSPIKLEAEKIFTCLMMLTKKRYIGVLTNGKTLMKGVDLVRKTACKFVQQKCSLILDKILKDKEVKAAAGMLSSKPANYCYSHGLPIGFYKIIDILNDAYDELLKDKIPIEDLSFSTELSRSMSAYKTTNLPHLSVYKKLVERNEELPQIHDRIQYVFIQTNSKVSRKCDMAEHPQYVIQNKIPIAKEDYYDKLIQGTANMIQCIFDNNCKATVDVLEHFIKRYNF